MVEPVPAERLLAMVPEETFRIADCAAADPGVAVPGCPGWDLAALAGHLGLVQLWVETMVRTGARERLDRTQLGPPPVGPARVDWLRAGAVRLAATLAAAGPGRRVWTFAGSDGRSAVWLRRMAHEAQIHRADAEAATGLSPAFEPWLAADGIDEFLQVMLPRCYQGGPVPGLRGVLALRCTDSDGAWTVGLGEDAAVVERGRSDEAECTATGPAGTVFGFVWNRPIGTAVRLEGDPEVAAAWRRAVRL